MLKLEKFDGTKTYMFPNGDIATPERIRQQFPAVDHFVHVLEVNGDVCQAVMNLNALRQIHTVDDGLDEAGAILAIQAEMNKPIPEPEPTAEERIAAAMEYDNLMKY